ncbi:MAG: Hsp70 family protein [Tannerella sp.]|jgi:molecular chaperone DnaK (HSP70)|nr:Hsp70 family protein [Tannerella sp.]
MNLGIDFGTCFSFPAAVRGNAPESLLSNDDDYRDGIPSIFYYESEIGERTGVEARKRCQAHPSYGVKYIKKEMRCGKPISQITYTLDGRKFSAKEIIVKIIRHIIDLAQQKAPDIPVSSELENIVIAVPAMSGSKIYRETILEAACEASGLSRKSVKLIDEPVAAALSYFSTRQNINNGTTILTYDLGGGTFDTAIVRYDAALSQKFKTRIQSGDTKVGGTNWDEELRKHFIRENDIRLQGSIDVEQFDREIIQIKHMLSTEDKVRRGFFPNSGEDVYRLEISRQQFEEMTRYLLDMTIEVVKDVIARYKETGGNESDINTIVLVGGASKMPQVINRLRQEFPTKEIVLDKPERAIAFGAAIYAASDCLITTAPHTYGVDCCNRDDDIEQISNILFRDSEMEVHDSGKYISAQKYYAPRYKNQTKIGFSVYETDEPKGVDWTPFNGRKPMFGVTVPVTPIDGIETKMRSFSAEFRLLQDGILELHIYDNDRNRIEVGFDTTNIF